MESKEQKETSSPAEELLDTVADIGLAATEDIPIDGVLESVSEVASTVTESIGEAIGSVFDSL